MGRKIDLTNQRFGKLLVISEYPDRTPQGSVQWICQCDCGNQTIVSGDNLRRNHTTSCGCAHKDSAQQRVIDLVGKRFGYLTVLKRGHTDINRNIYWKCQCDCGTIKEISGSNLREGKVKSCGCQMAKKPLNLLGQKFGKLTPIKQVYINDKAGWLCQCECGNQTTVITNVLLSGRTKSCGCINYSIGEKNIAELLEQNNIAFIREYKFQDLNNYRYDFYLPEYNRLIEFDGKQHYIGSGTWDKDTLKERQDRDKEKNQYALNHNIDLIRIPYWQRDKITLDMILGDYYLVRKE